MARVVLFLVVAILIVYVSGHAHQRLQGLAAFDIDGAYLIDDSDGVWTSFGGIGAISGGGVSTFIDYVRTTVSGWFRPC